MDLFQGSTLAKTARCQKGVQHRNEKACMSCNVCHCCLSALAGKAASRLHCAACFMKTTKPCSSSFWSGQIKEVYNSAPSKECPLDAS